MPGDGRVSYTPTEIEERQTFVLLRIRSGFSRIEIQRQFSQKFDCSYETARRWYNEAASELLVEDGNERKIVRASIIEMFHAQISSAQNDLVDITNEIASLDALVKRRKELVQKFLDHRQGYLKLTRREVDLIRQELETLPPIPFKTKMEMISVKSQMRDRLFRIMNELARLQGVYQAGGSWQDAVNTLMDNGLLPAAIAEQMLQVIENLNSQISRVSTMEEKESPIDDDIPL